MAKAITYGATTFKEAAGNNGAIATSVTIKLAEDTFTGANGAKLGSVTGVPSGLTAVLVKTSATTAKLSFTGTALTHANGQDIANLTVTFANSDFTGNVATDVTGATKNDLVIDFADPFAVGTLAITAPTASIGNTRPVLTGAATEKTSVVHVFNGTKDLGAASVNATTGLWTFTVPATVTDGTISFTAKEKFGDGTTATFGPPSAAVTYMLDTKAPTAPTVDAVKLPTSDTTPTLTGKAEKDASVEVFAGAVSLGKTTADAKGVWTLTAGSALAQGDHAITAKATDAAGNASVASTKPVTVTVDTAIDTPTLTTVLSATTKVATQKLEGLAEKGAKVQIYGGVNGTKALLAKEVIADKTTGKWMASVKLEDGTHKLKVEATDVAGNVSVASAVKEVTIDTKAPDAPTVTAPSFATGKTLPTMITGTAEAYAKVEVYSGSVKLGDATATDAGHWVLNGFTPAKALTDGVQKITAKTTDAAGNVSKASDAVSFTLDNKAPSAPTVDAFKLPTSDTLPTLTGKAEKDAEVEVFVGAVSLGTTTADAKGVWTLTVPAGKALTDGDHVITAKATDAANNVSAVTAKPVTVTVDTAIAVPTLTFKVDPTPSANPNITKVATQNLEGAGEKGAKVQIYGGADGSVALGNAIVVDKTTGNWKASVKLADGEHLLSVVATDLAGNISANSAVTADTTVIIDTFAPVTPVLTLADGGKGAALPITLSGTVEKGAKVEIYAGATKLGEVAAADTAAGTWSFDTADYSGTALKGAQKLTVKATDAAGNVSKASTAVTYTIEAAAAADTTAPTVSAFTVASATTLTLKSNEAGKAGLYDGTTLVGAEATLTKDTTGTITVGAATTLITGASLKVSDSATTANVTTHAANKVVIGTTGADTITVAGGNDYIFTFADADVLTFTSAAASTRVIADYTVADDSIQLSKAAFLALGSEGALTTNEFVSGAGAVATTTAHRIVYDSTTGNLSYDADGSGTGAAVLIGTFTGKPALDAAEFTIIA